MSDWDIVAEEAGQYKREVKPQASRSPRDPGYTPEFARPKASTAASKARPSAETMAEMDRIRKSVARSSRQFAEEAAERASKGVFTSKATGALRVAKTAGRAGVARLPVVGMVLDAATTAEAGYEGAKAYSAHSDLIRTAESLEKRGVKVEKPSFNPLKAAYPGVFGEHPEVKVKEVNRVGNTARKKKLGS